jgi:hypothetical protein
MAVANIPVTTRRSANFYAAMREAPVANSESCAVKGQDLFMTDEDEPVIRLVRWPGPWEDDDPQANLKADVALYSRLDPLKTLKGLSGNVGVPVGALARYVLARYATSGSGGILEIGPSMVHRLWEPIEEAEGSRTDVARLAAYDQLRQMIEWLRFPLVHPEVNDEPD